MRVDQPKRNGRTASGQFAKGNAGGPGNPHAKRVAELRAALLEAVTVEDIRAVVRSLVGQAREGDIPAARELLNRVLGKSPDDAEQEQPVVIEVITGVPDRDPSA